MIRLFLEDWLLRDLRLELGTALGVHAFVMMLASGRAKERRK